MINRRIFLKSLMNSSILGMVAPSLIGGMGLKDILKLQSPEFVYSNRMPEERRIFCMFDNKELEEEIKKCAKEIDHEIIYGEPFSPDILVLSGFFNVIDRNLVGRDMWEEYVSCCNEFGWTGLCCIIDNIRDLNLPESMYVIYCEMDIPNEISSIIEIMATSSGLRDRIIARGYRRWINSRYSKTNDPHIKGLL